jgi:hypothetical protein
VDIKAGEDELETPCPRSIKCFESALDLSTDERLGLRSATVEDPLLADIHELTTIWLGSVRGLSNYTEGHVRSPSQTK